MLDEKRKRSGGKYRSRAGSEENRKKREKNEKEEEEEENPTREDTRGENED